MSGACHLLRHPCQCEAIISYVNGEICSNSVVSPGSAGLTAWEHTCVPIPFLHSSVLFGAFGLGWSAPCSFSAPRPNTT